MRILVTGGLGYIGAHTVVALIEQNFDVVVVDDLSNTSLSALNGIEKITGVKPDFYEVDLRNQSDVTSFFESQAQIDGVIHFAASKAVGESVTNPFLYYHNNIGGILNLLSGLQKFPNSKFIFSSSCTVYGQADELPITESAPIKPAMSPYGNTKQIGEEILSDMAKADQIQAIALRYFNPIGAHESVEIGELPLGVPQNLVPFITQTAAGLRNQLSVFGADYPTPDGTCIRDYIYVVDLAEAHVVALQRLLSGKNQSNLEIFNLGTGKGSSVLEVINAFEAVSGKKLPYQIVARREGDVTAAYADTQHANEVLGWKAKNDLTHAIATAWKWEQKIRGI
ncbi:UDP-glucose 4-epimerase GalE [Flavobacterium sp.]|uniref:UDP-glucose 4-epimerase GalE n=1 Tax=Flavobacterium sp. TaxID=239 RepID=UPI003B9A4C93